MILETIGELMVWLEKYPKDTLIAHDYILETYIKGKAEEFEICEPDELENILTKELTKDILHSIADIENDNFWDLVNETISDNIYRIKQENDRDKELWE